jgi:transposase InsO family protein
MNVSEPDPNLDYHILLGHPSEKYLRQFFKLYNINPVQKNQLAKHCEICKQCKLKQSPHSNPLPTTDHPFKTLHIDFLQITPPSKSSMKYVLVFIDDYSFFNRIYLMQHKSNSDGKILSYVNEIINKTGKCPAIIHTNCGGEFSSKYFLSKLEQLGICIESGPANSPQTNRLAERFNQTLLVKIWCLLAQSLVPINYWDEAARYKSTLINLLPSKALNWSSPVNVLSELNLCIKPIRDVNKLIPFGLKVHVAHRPPSKISAQSKPLICLGYEDHLDALQFFDSTRRHIVISQDYTPLKLSFSYNSSSLLIKPPKTLPTVIKNSSSDLVSLKIPSPSIPLVRVSTPKTSNRTPPGTPGQQQDKSPSSPQRDASLLPRRPAPAVPPPSSPPP